MESHKNLEDNDVDSEKTDWGIIFIVFRSRGFTDEEILKLSYPKFKFYLENINNPLFYSIAVPYMGEGEDKSGAKMDSKEELFSIVADMNNEFGF